MAEAHDLPLEEYHRAGLEITNGNPEVSATLDRAAGNYRDGQVVGFENVSSVITPTWPTPWKSRATGRG
ncbi:MAG TPA: hypothetical protein VFR38_04450 [Gaiellaceae bacterium]|nr:hypothetical protein [Gaiellaceae bacterium]